MSKKGHEPEAARTNDEANSATSAITHSVVVEKFINENYADDKKSAQEFRSNCKAWCNALGSRLDAPAAETLGSFYARRLAEYQELLNRGYPDKQRARKNVRTAVAKLQAAYEAMLASLDLPADFNAAFKIAMDAKGYKPADINRLLYQTYYFTERKNWYGAQLWGFYDGTAGPGKCWKGDSRVLLTRCEVLLGLESNALVSRAYPVRTPMLMATFTEIPYRAARSRQSSAKYGLRSLPKQIAEIFDPYSVWRGRSTHQVDGEIIQVDGRSRWGSPLTTKLARDQFEGYFGWLCLPKPDKPMADLTEEEQWRSGKGLHPEEVRMAHLFDLTLVWEYIEFLRCRQHNHELTRGHVHFLQQINAFVSMPYSFLVNHPELAKDFGFDRPTSKDIWLVEMEEFHQKVLRLIRGVKRLVEGRQRSPDEPLKHVIEQADPYALLLEMIDRLEMSPPLRANKQRWAMWARKVALFRMESEVPLRTANVVALRIDQHIRKDPSTGIYRIYLSKSELKNSYSGHAEDIDRPYSAEASKAIDRYINEARKEFVGAEECNVFFLGPAAGKRVNKEFSARTGYMLSCDTIYWTVRNTLEEYFGAGQGAHIFRHIIATGILKEDSTQVEVAAAVLNNSPNTIRLNYKHLTQSDSIRLANVWFRKQRNKKEDRKKD